MSGDESAPEDQGSQHPLSGLGSAGQQELAGTPQAAIERAWEMARASGIYRYESRVTQTTYPAPKLTNAGRSPLEEHLAVVGEIDQPAETMELTLWPDASLAPGGGVEIRIEGNRAYGRVGQGEWEEVENCWQPAKVGHFW